MSIALSLRQMSLAQLMAEIRQVSKRSVEAYTLHIVNHLLMRRLIMSCLKSLLSGKWSQFSMELLYTSYLLIDVDFLGMQQMLRSKHIGSQGILASIREGYWVVRGWSEWMNTDSIKSIAWTGCTPLSMIVLWMQRLRLGWETLGAYKFWKQMRLCNDADASADLINSKTI